MKTVILAGGEGKRLRPYTYVLPKPLLPVGDKAILEILLERLKSQGFKDIVLTVGYRSNYIKTFFSDGSNLGLNISYYEETNPLGTAGPLKNLEQQLTKDFLVINGDILTDIDFNALSKFHLEKESDITVVTKKIKVPILYGVVKSKEHRIEMIEEKPTLCPQIVAGIYILNPSVLKYIPKNKFYNMPNLVKKVLEKNGKVLRFLHTGKWTDIGRLTDYQKAQSELVNKK